VKDAIRGIVYRDDSQVVDLRARKEFGERPGVELTVSTTTEAHELAEMFRPVTAVAEVSGSREGSNCIDPSRS
jgi:hypothetical protein